MLSVFSFQIIFVSINQRYIPRINILDCSIPLCCISSRTSQFISRKATFFWFWRFRHNSCSSLRSLHFFCKWAIAKRHIYIHTQTSLREKKYLMWKQIWSPLWHELGLNVKCVSLNSGSTVYYARVPIHVCMSPGIFKYVYACGQWWSWLCMGSITVCEEECVYTHKHTHVFAHVCGRGNVAHVHVKGKEFTFSFSYAFYFLW